MQPKPTAHTPTSDRIVFAHRGLNRVAPENTMPAFELAADAGATWLETDVDIISDDTPILIHDSTLDRTTNRFGSIYDLTAADLSDVDAGSWLDSRFTGTPIPTLGQLVEFMNEREMNCNLELKAHETGKEGALRMIDAVIEELDSLDPEREVIVSSFAPFLLAEFHRRAPNIAIGALWETLPLPDAWRSALEFVGASYVHVADTGLTQSTVQQLTDAGYGVNVWTVNAKDRANQLFNWGATGVFTDVADEMLHLQRIA